MTSRALLFLSAAVFGLGLIGCGSGSGVQLGTASQQDLNDAAQIKANGTTFQVEKAKGNYSGSPEQQLARCFADWGIRLPGRPTAQERRWQITAVSVPGFSEPYFVGIAKSKGTTYAYVWVTKLPTAADKLAKRLNKAAQKIDSGYQTIGVLNEFAESEAVGQVVRAIPDWTNAYWGGDSSAWNGCALRLRDSG